jgi:hypothetical protein
VLSNIKVIWKDIRATRFKSISFMFLAFSMQLRPSLRRERHPLTLPDGELEVSTEIIFQQ